MLFIFENGVPLMPWGRQWCAASIKPGLLFSHAGYAS